MTIAREMLIFGCSYPKYTQKFLKIVYLKNIEMPYYIYENWVAEKKAVIHKGSCAHCNDGQGCHQHIYENKNDKWHGPFDTYEEAKNFANTLKNRTVRPCGKCHPDKD